MVLPMTLTLLLAPLMTMPASTSALTKSRSLDDVVPLLSAITLPGPMMSEIMLGLKLVGAVSGLVSVLMPLLPLPMCCPTVDGKPMRLPMMKLGRYTLPDSTRMP